MAPEITRYFLRRIDVPADAADLLNETLIVAWKKQRTIPADPEGERAWLFTVASNVLLNHRRSSTRRTRLIAALRAELTVDVADDRSDVQADVAAALRELPPTEAEIVRLVHWEGLSQSEAGRVLGIPQSTARAKYATARNSLSRALRHLGG